MESSLTCILGSYGEGNVGDEAILDGILTDIRATSPHEQFIVFSHNPRETEQQHPGITAFPVLPAGIRSFALQGVSGQLQRSLYAIKAANDIVIGGGGIFYDDAFSTGRNPVNVWRIRCNTIRRMGKQYRIHAVGVATLTQTHSKNMLREIFMNAATVSVRDPKSKQRLQEYSVTCPINIVEDPALHIATPPLIPHTRSDTPRIGLCIRQWYLTDREAQKLFVQKVQALIQLLIHELHASVILIPLSVGKDDDRELMLELKATLALPESQLALSLAPHTVQDRLQEIGALQLMIGMRFHSLIFAEKMGVPWIGLAYADKVSSLSHQMNKEKYCLPLNTTSVRDIITLATTLL